MWALDAGVKSELVTEPGQIRNIVCHGHVLPILRMVRRRDHTTICRQMSVKGSLILDKRLCLEHAFIGSEIVPVGGCDRFKHFQLLNLPAWDKVSLPTQTSKKSDLALCPNPTRLMAETRARL